MSQGGFLIRFCNLIKFYARVICQTHYFLHTLYNTAAADYYYQNEKVSTAEVSNENERDGDCQGKTDAHPQEIGLSEGQPDPIVAKGRQQNDGKEYQLKRNNEKCSLLQRSARLECIFSSES